MPENLTKLDVARRQLAVAIRLFFDNRDPVSVYTLAGNAWEIIDTLCKHRGVDYFSPHVNEFLPDGMTLKHDVINPFRNFFKHADKDPEATLEVFSDDVNDGLLMLAGEDLLRLEETKLCECQIFQIWYLGVYEEKIATEELERVLPEVRSALPNIRQVSRIEQKKMGRELLQRQSTDLGAIIDPLTDMTELFRWDRRAQ